VSHVDRLKTHLKDSQAVHVTSAIFFDSELKPLLKSLLSNLIKNICDIILKENSKIPYIRKSTVFSNQVVMDTKMTEIFDLFLKNEIFERCKEPYLDWHNLVQDRSFIANGAFLAAARRSMVSNINQPPIIVTRHAQKNRLGLPLYFPIHQARVATKTPEIIVYIGMKTMI
jgi:hypothetical protein